jgi:hypothetical protein
MDPLLKREKSMQYVNQTKLQLEEKKSDLNNCNISSVLLMASQTDPCEELLIHLAKDRKQKVMLCLLLMAENQTER